MIAHNRKNRRPAQHPFLWENGWPAVDVSTLYPPLASGLALGGLRCINDLGEMVGTGIAF